MSKRNKYLERLDSQRNLPVVLVYDNPDAAGPEAVQILGRKLTEKQRAAGKQRQVLTVVPWNGTITELAQAVEIQIYWDGDKNPHTGARIKEPTAILTPRIGLLTLDDDTNEPYVYTVFGAPTLFTKTSKMRAPSWSIPAGPPKVGGTCVASAAKPEDDALFICRGCYASDGNYRYGTKQISMAIMREIVREGMIKGTFAPMMTHAIKVYRAKTRTDNVTRKVDGKDVKFPYTLDTDFFRIHDSGDLWWATNGPEYLEAWIEVARQCPGVNFWAPARDWVLGPTFIRAYQQAMQDAPANFVLRPSAIHVGDVAPQIDGLSAGTSVSYGAVADGLADAECPAYNHELDVSCATANHGRGCRMCWLEPETTVNYQPHGSEMSKKKLGAAIAMSKSSRRPRRNPQMNLEDVYRAYHRDPSHNPGDQGFQVWLSNQGIDSGDWPESDWFELLRDLGLDDDEAAEYLSSVAEDQP